MLIRKGVYSIEQKLDRIQRDRDCEIEEGEGDAE